MRYDTPRGYIKIIFNFKFSISNEILFLRERILFIWSTEMKKAKEIKTNAAGIINRVARIEGQVRGLKKMLEEGRECSKIVAQVLAVREAVTSLGAEILQNELVCEISERKKVDEKFIKSLLKMK